MDADPTIPVALGFLERRIDHVVHECALPGTADTGDARQHAERDLDVDFLEVVFRGTQNSELLIRRLAAHRRHRNRQLVAQILRGQRTRLVEQRRQRTTENDPAALFAGTQSHVDDGVGDADHVGVMFDDQHGVALVAQLAQDRDQPLVVARMQADRRFVEHVERVDERRPERGGEIDPLRLAARERRRQAIERQVVETDVAKEAEPLPDFAQHLVGNGRFFFRQRQARRKKASASWTVRPHRRHRWFGRRPARRGLRAAVARLRTPGRSGSRDNG